MVMIQETNVVTKNAQHPPPAVHKPRAESGVKKVKPPAKPPQDPDAVFPCKKCNRYESQPIKSLVDGPYQSN